jgi:hypothetical protein
LGSLDSNYITNTYHLAIPNIPLARYIFIFVDFNERNVILEKPDQNLGDKKVVTVNSAQKLGGMYFLYNYCLNILQIHTI